MDRNFFIKKLWKNLLYTFLISYLLTFITLMVVFSKEAGSLEGNQGLTIFCLLGFAWILFLTLLSTTTFLNLYSEVRSNIFYAFLSYYALPIVASLIIIFTNNLTEWASLYLSIIIPFFLTHSFFFYKRSDFFVKFIFIFSAL